VQVSGSPAGEAFRLLSRAVDLDLDGRAEVNAVVAARPPGEDVRAAVAVLRLRRAPATPPRRPSTPART
jgi:hypothetical protein